jgi:hypothetical protein
LETKTHGNNNRDYSTDTKHKTFSTTFFFGMNSKKKKQKGEGIVL